MIRKIIKRFISMPPFPAIARRRNRHEPLILMYHGLSRDPSTRDWTQVAVDDFLRQMTWLRKKYRPISLDEMVARLEADEIEPHTAVVTFDDGYISNHSHAYPILHDLDIPATVFVTSGFVLQDRQPPRFLWPDFITALLTSHKSRKLDLEDFDLGQYDLSSMRSIYNARNRISEKLKSTASSRTEEIISSLQDRYGDRIKYQDFEDYFPMDRLRLRELSAGGLVTIGAHSRTHPILSRLEGQRLEDEIVGSKNDLEAVIGSEITAFAYPNGRWQDINRDVVDITARHFRCAVTTEMGRNPRGQNKYLLRRIGIGRNLELQQFKALLSGAYFTGRRPDVAV